MPKVSNEYLEQKRKEITDAAYRVCIRKPITSIDMKDVINETGFSHGVVYRYYKDLDEILADLIVRINSEHRIDDKVDAILNEYGNDYDTAIHRICEMLADYIREVGVGIMKVSVYCDVLAMSEPERVMKFAGKIQSEGQSSLVYLAAALSSYLTKTVKNNELHPTKSIDEIMQFFIASFQGIQMGFVLTESIKIDGLEGRYQLHDMFSCLADSTVLMTEGRR